MIQAQKKLKAADFTQISDFETGKKLYFLFLA